MTIHAANLQLAAQTKHTPPTRHDTSKRHTIYRRLVKIIVTKPGLSPVTYLHVIRPLSVCFGGSLFVSTNNNTASPTQAYTGCQNMGSKQHFIPPYHRPHIAILLLAPPQCCLPVCSPRNPTGPGDADANKGPRAVWSGRPIQREEGGSRKGGYCCCLSSQNKLVQPVLPPPSQKY